MSLFVVVEHGRHRALLLRRHASRKGDETHDQRDVNASAAACPDHGIAPLFNEHLSVTPASCPRHSVDLSERRIPFRTNRSESQGTGRVGVTRSTTRTETLSCQLLDRFSQRCITEVVKNARRFQSSCSPFLVRGGGCMQRRIFSRNDGVLNPPLTSNMERGTGTWNRLPYSILKNALALCPFTRLPLRVTSSSSHGSALRAAS